MPVPADFPSLRENLPQRKPPPDFTSRGTKLRLFAALAAVMLVAAVLERGCDPRVRLAVQNRADREPRNEVASASVEAVPGAAGIATPDREEMLNRFGIGPEAAAEIADGQPLSAAEEELLLKALHFLPRLGRENVEHWQRDLDGGKELASEPAEHRTEVYDVRGRARSVEKVAVPEAEALRYEFEDYYRVELELEESERRAVVFTRNIPEAWPVNQRLDEAVAASGLFLKLGELQSDREPLVFVADRVAWLPDKLNRELGVGLADVRLASAGMDMGLWDDVRQANRLPLEARDREAFYQLLAALGRPQAAELAASDAGRLELATLLQEPREQQGEFFVVSGVARRITRIEVPDADVQARFGLDHYYEIDLFLLLGEARIRLGEGTDEAPVFENRFPATLVVRELPAGVKPRTSLHVQVRAEAVFFKVWTYESRYAGKFGQVQPAPLFVAKSVRLVESAAAPAEFSSVLKTAALVLSLVAAVGGVWWMMQTSRRRRTVHLPPPDFRGLR